MDKNREEAARAILLVNNDIVTIKRTKYNGDSEYVYYTLPGGHVEKGETFEETVIREVEEELGIKVKIEEEFMSIYNEDIDKVVDGELEFVSTPLCRINTTKLNDDHQMFMIRLK